MSGDRVGGRQDGRRLRGRRSSILSRMAAVVAAAGPSGYGCGVSLGDGPAG